MSRQLYRLRTGIIRLFMEDLEKNCEPDECKDLILQALTIYTDELERKAMGVAGDLDTLATIKKGIRTASRIIETMQDEAQQDIAGWYYGKKSENPVENLYGLLMQIVMELSLSVSFLEDDWPEMKAEFDQERQEYVESTRK